MKYLNYCFILFMLSSCITSTKNNNKTVQLNGHISNFKEGKVKLYYLYPAPISYKLVDSADLINGNFSFDKTLEEPCIALLKFEAKDYKVYYTRSFWIENSKINIKLALEANHLVDIIEGSEIDQLSNKINFFWALPKGNQNIINDSLKKEYIQKLSKIIESNDQSFYMLYGINQARGFLSLEEINFLISKLSYKINDFPTGRKLSIILKNSKNTEVNNYISNFNLKDINGNIFTLSSIKSKIILIDFWATWCVPCLKQIEELKNIYSKYKNRGFDIVSISIDDDSKVWTTSSKKIKIPWINLLGDSSVKNTNRLTFIPQNILINQNGLIFKKNLSMIEINKQLDSLLKPE